MKTLVLILITIFPTTIFASEDYLVAHLASYHPDIRTYNEVNTGMAYRHYEDRNFLSIGEYKNSLSKQSFYMGGGIDILKSNYLTLSITGGLITGYKIDIAPFLIPELSVNYKGVKIIVNYVPKIDNIVEAALGFSMALKF